MLDADFDVRVRHSRAEALALLSEGKFAPALALIDLGLPPQPDSPVEGFKLLGDLLARPENIRVLVLSGQNQESNARRARALGAADLVPKPCEPTHLRRALFAALSGRDENAGRILNVAATLIGDSPAMRQLRSQIDLYAASRFPALIEGESGSGKERVAAALHHLSPNSNSPFLALNCAAISASLVEPTLFGYAKGAFTGAVSAKSGYFEDAADGTLFLDEIGELPLDLQPKLLRVLENGEYQRVGETMTRTSRARVLTATNRDLKAEVRAGRFRADLYHRLSVLSIAVPPLRSMDADKLKLLDHYRAEFAQQQRVKPFSLSTEARSAWLHYNFPGNVRELKNIVIRLTAKHGGYEVASADLKMEFAIPESSADAMSVSAATLATEIQSSTEFRLDSTLAKIELAYIDAAIAVAHGNMSQAARLLGVSRSTLYSRLESLRPGVAQAGA